MLWRRPMLWRRRYGYWGFGCAPVLLLLMCLILFLSRVPWLFR